MAFTPILGLDADEDLSAHAAMIAVHGFAFIMGYSRILTPKIVAAYHKAGLLVGVIDEKKAARALEGRAAGEADGTAMLAYMQKLGAPKNAAVFATVDNDAGEPELPAIEAYFAGYDAKLWPAFQIGGYADGTVLSQLRQDGMPICWLAGAGGWQGSHAFALTQTPELMQGPTIGPQGGAWKPAGMTNSLQMPALGFAYDPDICMVPLAEAGLF